MAVAETIQSRAKARPRTVTAVVSVIGYVLVVGTFEGLLPIYPELSTPIVNLLGDAIAVVNAATVVAIVLGVRAIRRGDVQRHRRLMLVAFGLITLFLAMYLLKIGGGFEKGIEAEGLDRSVYRFMLGIHIVLSGLAVPLVVHAVVLGLTHSPAELRRTVHARVGRVAVWAWGVSLVLGLVTYVMLNHVYGWEPLHATLFLVAVPRLAGRSGP